MALITSNKTTLYCPRCRAVYEEGTRRFCDRDGTRLHLMPQAANSIERSGGIFKNLFSKFSEHEENPIAAPASGKVFEIEREVRPKIEALPKNDFSAVSEKKSETAPASSKPLPRIVRPNEIPSGTAEVGNRQKNPAGRTALSWKNPNALVGQSVKGRYRVVEKLAEEEESIVYLAEDKIVESRRTIVRVFMEIASPEADFTERIFAEERVSLAHLKHPNIARIFDSGELPEGNVFIISEYVEGKSLRDLLRQSGQLNALRTARIVRQTAYALSEAHQNGILHRSLAPENIVLTETESGIEQVKLINFGLPGNWTPENLVYKSPEEIEGGISTFASDLYALAAIAYQMLTARLPFEGRSAGELLRAQKKGLKLFPANFRLDVEPAADKVLERALAFSASERYPKARDFGDAFFNALTKSAASEEKPDNRYGSAAEPKPSEPVAASEPEIEDDLPIVPDIHIVSHRREEDDDAQTEAADGRRDALRESRVSAPSEKSDSMRIWQAILSLIMFLALIFAISHWYLNRPPAPDAAQPVQTTQTKNP